MWICQKPWEFLLPPRRVAFSKNLFPKPVQPCVDLTYGLFLDFPLQYDTSSGIALSITWCDQDSTCPSPIFKRSLGSSLASSCDASLCFQKHCFPDLTQL